MSEILSQAEIEALLNSLSSEAEPLTAVSSQPTAPSQGWAAPTPAPAPAFTPGTRSTRTAIAYEVYDFRRPDKFSKDQLRTLQMLHETFARLAGSNLAAYLRAPVTIDLISLEQIPYEEYLRSISGSLFTIMSLPPLTGQAVLEMEFPLLFTMIDRMLGGPGRAINRTVLSDIERPLVRQIIERVFHALKSAWEGVVIVSPNVEGMESSAQFVQIAPPNDIVVTILFEVKVAGQRNAMSLCIPYLVLKPITAKLSAQKWFAGSNRKVSPVSRRILSQQVSQTQVPCTIELGQTELSVSEVLALKAGDVVRLDQRTNDDLRLLVGDVPKFNGKAALQGRQLVFAINDTIPTE